MSCFKLTIFFWSRKIVHSPCHIFHLHKGFEKGFLPKCINSNFASVQLLVYLLSIFSHKHCNLTRNIVCNFQKAVSWNFLLQKKFVKWKLVKFRGSISKDGEPLVKFKSPSAVNTARRRGDFWILITRNQDLWSWF